MTCSIFELVYRSLKPLVILRTFGEKWEKFAWRACSSFIDTKTFNMVPSTARQPYDPRVHRYSMYALNMFNLARIIFRMYRFIMSTWVLVLWDRVFCSCPSSWLYQHTAIGMPRLYAYVMIWSRKRFSITSFGLSQIHSGIRLVYVPKYNLFKCLSDCAYTLYLPN